MMSGYRPKSLDELNSIFDKTIAAEKAIKKNSSMLEKGEDSFSSFSVQLPSEDSMITDAAEEKRSENISANVSDFIAKFSAQTEPVPVKAKPSMTVLFTETAPKEIEAAAESPVKQEAEKISEKPSRDDLFSEYARIMADDDEDFPVERKLSRKEKKKLRKKEKAESKAVQPAPTEVAAEPATVEENAEYAAVEETSESAVVEENEEADDLQSFSDEAADEAEEYTAPIAEEESFIPEQEPVAEDETDKRDDFDFPDNYTPEWIKDENGDDEPIEATAEEIGIRKSQTLLKILLSVLLVALLSISSLATVFHAVVAVNTGKLVSDRYYVFTTYKDYEEAGLKKGDLVITEKKYAEDGEIFVYVDYASKSFEFGKRTDSITKEDGEVLYVTENDGERTLVSRDDSKGVIYLTYDGRGELVSFLTDNYIVIVSLCSVAALAIVLVFILVLRKKKEEYDDEEYEIEGMFSDEEDFEDIFSTVE